MATKRTKEPKEKEKTKAAGRGKGKSDIRMGPRYEKAVREPINKLQYSKKESEIAQLELEVSKLQRKIKPEQIEIRKARKKIAALAVDLEDNTEERKVLVRNEYHDNRNTTRILRADNGACVEERPMLDSERQLDNNLDDLGPDPIERKTDGDPAPTPGAAMAAAREEGQA